MTGSDDDLIAKGKALAESGEYEPYDEDPVADAEERELYPAPSAPLNVARKLYREATIDDIPTLRAWRGGWMRWGTTQWTEIGVDELRSNVYKTLENADYLKPVKAKGVVVDSEQTPWDPNRHKVSDVLEAMAAIGHLSSGVDSPDWIAHSLLNLDPSQIIACANGLLDVSTRGLVKHTPALFNLVSVPFDYDENAPEPQAWLAFLASMWGEDAESVALLQEYVGYVLSGRLDLQKMLLLIGPTRSGKGTIARMLKSLIGKGHVVGPTLASLGTNFGLAPLIGKPLAVVSDARLGNSPSNVVVERLLSITGEDTLTFDRKYREAWSGKLPTRFVILTNELPRFKDSSGAIANRLLILRMTKSFLGNEDRSLDARLSTELPGILNWALEGLDRLIVNGKFTVPRSSDDATALMMDLASPVSAFVRDCCQQGADEWVERDGLYSAYRRWCFDNGHQPASNAVFGRDLRSVVPELGTSKRRLGVGGAQIRCYTYITVLPASPASRDYDDA